MGQKKKVTNLQLIKALSKHCGIYADAARELGISKQAVYKRIKSDEEIAEAYEDICEQWLDTAEYQLMQLIEKDKNLNAIMFYLKAKGKERGYTE